MKYLPGFLLLVGSWLQPLHLLPWVSWHSEVLAVSAVWWFFMVALFEKKGGVHQPFQLPLLGVFPFVLMLLVTAQYLSGLITFFGDLLVVSFYLATCTVAIFVGYSWELNRSYSHQGAQASTLLEQLFLAILIGAIASALLALVQTMGVWEWADWIVRSRFARRPGANVGQPNHLATLLVMGIASMGYFFESKKASLGFSIAMLFLLTFALAMSESRTGLLSVAAVSLWWLFKSNFSSLGRRLVCVTSLWLGVGLMVYIWPIFITAIYFDGANDPRIRLNSGLRLLMWPQIIEVIRERPAFGWGWGQLSKALNSVLHSYDKSLPFTYSHNLILDLGVSFGIPFTVACIAASTVYVATRARAANSPISQYCVAVSIPLGIHSMLEFPYTYAYFLFPVMLALGTLEASLGLSRTIRLHKPALALGGSLVCATMFYVVVEYSNLEEDFRVARFEALRVGSRPMDYDTPKVVLLTQLGAMIASTRIVAAPHMTKAQINLLESTAKRFPWSAMQYRYGLSLALNGNPAEAKRQMLVIRAMHGEEFYLELKKNWHDLATNKYPVLNAIDLP